MQRQMQRVDAINQPTRNFIVACIVLHRRNYAAFARNGLGFAPKSLLSTPSFKSHLSILLLNYWKYKYKWFIGGRWKFLSS